MDPGRLGVCPASTAFCGHGSARLVARIEGPPGAGRTVGAAVLLVLVALAMARFVVTGGWAMVVFYISLPIVFLVLLAVFGWVLASLGTAFFLAAVFAFRAVVAGPGGWIVIVMAPVAAFTGLIVLRVLRRMRRNPGSVAESGQEGSAAATEPKALGLGPRRGGGKRKRRALARGGLTCSRGTAGPCAC